LATPATLLEFVLQLGLGHRLQTMPNNQDVADKNNSNFIFIVDDDPDVRRAMQRLLKMANFRVETFATAEEFLSSGHSRSPGVLILDLRLPGMNGKDLQKALADSGSTLPIVFMTAYEDEGVRQEVTDRGAVAFLQKPVDERTLLEAIDKASRRRAKVNAEDGE
jgi:FixJ family two-component response regulator